APSTPAASTPSAPLASAPSTPAAPLASAPSTSPVNAPSTLSANTPSTPPASRRSHRAAVPSKWREQANAIGGGKENSLAEGSTARKRRPASGEGATGTKR
ncbi:hypothetical protein BV22DRAFT_1134054, partial [Leucogyrophana mollusca]